MDAAKALAKYEPQVQSAISRALRKMPRHVRARIERADLETAGRMAIFLSLREKPDQVGQVYMYLKARWAVMDELRTQDWLSRDDRERNPKGAVVPLEDWHVQATTEPKQARVPDRRMLLRAIGVLSDREAYIIRAVDIRGVSVTQVAAKLRVSPPAVSSIRTAALRKLRFILESEMLPAKGSVAIEDGAPSIRRGVRRGRAPRVDATALAAQELPISEGLMSQ